MERGCDAIEGARLTKGRRWAVFGVTIIPSITFILLNVSMGFVSELVAMKEWVTDTIDYLIAATSTAYFAVLTTVLYSDLRREKDGADSGELARVFD